MEDGFMIDIVKAEDIERFSEIYNLFERQNMTLKTSIPDEIKDLSAIDISVLEIVTSDPDIIVRELGKILNVPNSTLTSALNRLEEKGLAERTINKRDRRSFGIKLTDRGTRVQALHLEFEKAYLKSMLEKLNTHEERGLLLNMLKKCVS
jgi:DNA-binding MarR family transcriptional regulator